MLKEFEIGKTMADVAKESGVKKFVFSSLADAEKISNKKYRVPHFTEKAHIEEYVKKIGLSSVAVGPAGYYQNFPAFHSIQPDGKGKI